ncbi:MAG TPA: glycosyltransferase family 2 protein [Solirubrobacteraceae bacterium]|nr:glycosyltransferase family 2 protein [Solirubrobacteraceae bacterium]
MLSSSQCAPARELRVLVVATLTLPEGRDSSLERVGSIVEPMCADGHRVTCLLHAGGPADHSVAKLVSYGAEVSPVTPSLDFPGLLERERFDAAFLVDDTAVARCLPAIQQASPLTKVFMPDQCDHGCAVPTQFVVDTYSVDPETADAALRSYVLAHSADDPVSLAVVIDPDQTQAAFARATAVLDDLGLDATGIADVVLAPCAPDFPLPSSAVTVGQSVPADWRAAAAAAVTPTIRRPRPRATLALIAGDDPRALALQRSALERARIGSDVEVSIIASGHGADMEREMERASGARIVRCGTEVGRRQAWQLAAEASRADHIVALSPLALPQADFVEPLIERVRSGAALAGPVVAGSYGFRVAEDGSLWPREEHQPNPPAALALDCIAARRDLLLGGLPELPAGEGHAEVQLARWAAEHGGIGIAPGARVERHSAGNATAVVCTHNRAEELRPCVAALEAAGFAEILIVDNGSTDDTAAVVAELVDSSEMVSAVFEPEPGLSNARNAAAAAARHELLLFLDDDARPAPGWREHLTWALADPSVVHAGGPVCALWPSSRKPGWPGRDLEWMLSVLDHGDATGDLIPPKFLFGANWAIKRSALMAAGGFDPALGWNHAHGKTIAGEEVRVAELLHEAGLGRTRYIAAAATGHRIAPHRIDPVWINTRSMSIGIELVCHPVLRGEASREEMVAWAERAAHLLFPNLAHAGVPLTGAWDVDRMLAAITSTALPLPQQSVMATWLGEVAAAVTFAGEQDVLVEDLRLTVTGVVPPLEALRPDCLTAVAT